MKGRIAGVVVGAAFACLPATGALALTLPLPSPSPLPSILPSIPPLPLPSVSPLPLPSTAPLPLPSVSPLPLPLATPSLPVNVPLLGGQGGHGGGGAGGGTGGSGAGGGPGGPGSAGGSSGSAPGGVIGRVQSAFSPEARHGAGGPTLGGPVLAGLIPLPAFPGLPAGTAQDVAWLLTALVPVLLLAWVVTLIRTLGSFAMWRSSSAVIAAAADLGLSPRELAGMSPAALLKVREQLAVDELTGCMRRASGVAALEREVARARRDRSPLAIAFVDADGLKQANDSRGHAEGDALLRDIATGLRERLRGSDFVFRFGGDEFVCVLPGATLSSASDVVMAVQTGLRERGRSFSFGIAELAPAEDTVKLLGRADEELYKAKRALKIEREAQAEARERQARRSAAARRRGRPDSSGEPA